MRERVSRSMESLDPETANTDNIAVAHFTASESHRILGADEVMRTVQPSQLQATADVIVVHVGFGNGGNSDALLLRE